MRILVVCQHYYPEPFRIADICEALVKEGHSVTVVTGLPNYPMGYVPDEYKKGKKRHEVLNGVEVHRTFTIGRRKGVIWRFLNYYSFAFSSSRFVKKLKDEYDVILVNQLSPVMMARAGVKYKKKHKDKKLVYYCLDLWPESLVAGGIKKGSFIYRIFHRISKKLYRSADSILVTSKNFVDYFKIEFGIEDAEYLPQYAEDLFTPEVMPTKDTIDLTFAGNIGAAQSVETVIRAASELRDVKNLRIHIVGDGSSIESCKALAGELGTDNVIFHGRRPLEEMPAFYAMSDAMLVTLGADPFLSIYLPGKVQSYMAAGKPVIGAINGETAEVIADANCGFCGAAEDSSLLAENIRSFIASDKTLFSENAARYYKEHFAKEIFIERLLEELGAKERIPEPIKETV